MKIGKHFLPFLLVILSVLCTGCSGRDKASIREVITKDLALLKNLDSETTMKYISYQELFPNATQNTELSAEIKEVFSLFFQDFDYKIRSVSLDRKKQSAVVNVELTTLDASALAADFTAASLSNEIMTAAKSTENTNDNPDSLEERYLLLHQLLINNEYETAKRNCSIALTKNPSKNVWVINRTYSLENDLVGGLISSLSDPDILPPQDTLTVYLDTLKKMNPDEMSRYLGLESILHSEDATKNAIAEALVDQVHSTFDFEITDTEITGYQAFVETNITTFDSNSIMENYQNELEDYLATPAAVIDGADIRHDKSHELLLKKIEENDQVVTSQVTFSLINDGVSWKLKDTGETLGEAIFGSLSSTEMLDEDGDAEEPSDDDSEEENSEE